LATDLTALEPNALMATAEQADLSALMAKLDERSGVQNLTKSFTGERSTISSGRSRFQSPE